MDGWLAITNVSADSQKFYRGRLLARAVMAVQHLDQLGDVILRRVIWHPAHRHAVAFGQRNIEQSRRLFCVFEKQLVKIPKTKQQKRVGRNAFPQPLILLHHGSDCVPHHFTL